MNKVSKLWILGLFLIIFILNLVNVSAGIANHTVLHYSMEQTYDGNILYDETGQGRNGTAPSNVYNTGIIGNMAIFDANTDYFKVNDPSLLEFGAGDFSISLWYNSTNLNEHGYFWKVQDGAAYPYYYLRFVNDNKIKALMNDDDTSKCTIDSVEANTSWRDGQFHHIVFVKKGNDCTDASYDLYIDNHNIPLSFTPASTGAMNFDDIDDAIFGNTKGGSYCIGNGNGGGIDEFTVVDIALTSDNVSLLYNDSHGTPYPFEFEAPAAPAATQAEITCTQNLTDNYNGTDSPLYFGLDCVGNVAATTDNWQLKLYLNDTLNLTQNVTLNVSIFTLNLSYDDEETAYDINITLEHSEDNANYTSQVTNVFLDSVIPLTSETDFVNNTIYYYNYSTLFSMNNTASDSNLYAVNYSLVYPNGTVFWNWFNDTITTTTFTSTYNLSLNNASKYTHGDYEFRVSVWDSHTDNIVLDKDWKTYDDKIVFENVEFTSDSIKYENKLGIDQTYFWKTDDRYKMKVTFQEDLHNHGFNISAPGWKYIGNKYGYNGHFVNLGLGMWMDFEGKNIKDLRVYSKGQDKWEVWVDHYTKTDEVEFESIGDLNEIHEYYVFSLQNSHEIRANNSITESAISSFTTTVYIGGVLNATETTTSGICYLPYLSGYHNVSVNASGYYGQTLEINFSNSNSSQFTLNSTYTTYIRFDTATDAIVMDNLNSWNESSVNLIGISSGDIEIGDVMVFFNGVSGVNWSQVYEWYNDGTVAQNVNISLFDTADTLAYFKVLDANGNPIEDAIITIEFTYGGSSPTDKEEYKLMSRRLTAGDGYAKFWMDSKSKIRVNVTATDKIGSTRLFLVEEIDASTQDTAILIPLDAASEYLDSLAELTIPYNFKENQTEIKGYVTLDYDATVQFNTDHNTTLVDMTQNYFTRIYKFTLYNGSHYPNHNNFTFNLYIDSVYTASIDVLYLDPDRDEIIPLSGVDSNVGRVLMFIALILVSVIIGSMMPGIPTAGATTFRIGAVLLTLISTSFLNLAMINLLYMIFKLLYRQVSE